MCLVGFALNSLIGITGNITHGTGHHQLEQGTPSGFLCRHFVSVIAIVIEELITPNDSSCHVGRVRKMTVKIGLSAPLAVAVLAGALMTTANGESKRSAVESLKSPSEFQSFPGKAERSRAIFAEIGKVITNPRCMNCHPAGDQPLQGDDHHEHVPRVFRSDGDHLATNCAECHTEQNVTLHEAATYQSIPGNPRWSVAPLSMAWQNKSLGDICRQLKDVERNGGRSLASLQEHIAKDDLVGWAWHPGAGRDPAPGTQEEAGDLVQAWIDTGAECPH